MKGNPLTLSSCLAGKDSTFVLDTSVLIYLQSCSSGKLILESVSNRLVIAKEASDEILDSDHSYEASKLFAQSVIDSELVHNVLLSDNERKIYEKLIGRETRSLGKGEAATIAVAYERGHTAVIDDRKARKIAENEFGLPLIGRSYDILVHPDVQSILDYETFKENIVQALQIEDIAFDKNIKNDIIRFIGIENARKRQSLIGSIPVLT